jgi:membrane protein implicated in regulation of membrane protease activity
MRVRDALLAKLSFWLIVIGAFALMTPNPAWPEWLARMVLSTGIALAITTLIVKYRERKKKSG